MNKGEFIKAVAEKSGLTAKDSEKALNAILNLIPEKCFAGEKIQFVGFGSFEAKTRPAHEGINPKDGSKLMIGEKTTVAFKAGRELKK